MDWLLDALRDIAVYIVVTCGTAIAAWAAWVTRVVIAQHTRIALLEQALNQIPADTAEIKQTLREMREEGSEGRKAIHQRIDNVRTELREDIRKHDRR